ncbi:NAD-dependent epimerase/dehydratase family protein [bacterium]|nr:NAD-dependent epimerase/dehydratase family protein [bacterium]
MKVLITGGAGFIGSHLIEKLLREGAKKVICLDNLVAGSKKNIEHLLKDRRFKLIIGNVKDYKTVQGLVSKSDFVFHEAASKLVVSREKPRVDLETNILGTFNILEAARGKDIRIIHASTGSTLGSSDRPMKEDHPPKPTTLYGISKLTAERYCQFYAKEFGVKVSILRYFHVFGPRQDYSTGAGVVSIFLSRVLENKPPIIFGTGEQIRCFTYIDDDIDATLLLASKDEAIGEIYHVASKTRMSVKELAELIIKKYGPEGMEPIYASPRPGENLRPIPDTTKIEKLGFKAKVSFLEGLERTKEWVERSLSVKG